MTRQRSLDNQANAKSLQRKTWYTIDTETTHLGQHEACMEIIEVAIYKIIEDGISEHVNGHRLGGSIQKVYYKLFLPRDSIHEDATKVHKFTMVNLR